MIKKTIEYEDLDGNPVVGDFYFHLSKGDIAELHLTHDGEDLGDYLREIVDSRDGQAIVDNLKKFIALSVGVRAEDGRRFIKSPEITNDFMQTDAYGELLLEMVGDPNAAADFIMGIFPPSMTKHLSDEESDRDYTDEQLLAMTDDEFNRVVGKDPKQMTQRQLLIGMERKSQRTEDGPHQGRARKRTAKKAVQNTRGI